MLPFPFVNEEPKRLIFLQWPAHGTAELLPAVGRRRLICLLREKIVGIEGLIAEEAIGRAVIAVGAGFGDDVDGRSLAAPVSSRESLRADRKFLHRFERSEERRVGKEC